MYSTHAILARLLRSLEWGGRIQQNMALAYWPEVVGPVVAAACNAEEVRDGILYVRTPGSTWSQELSLLKYEIIPRLNERIGDAAVRDIKFRAGRKRAKHDVDPPTRHTAADLAAVELTEEDRSHLASALVEADSITDAQIRQATLRLVERAIRLRRWRLLHGWEPCPVCGVPQPGGTGVCTICTAMARMPAKSPPPGHSGGGHPLGT